MSENTQNGNQPEGETPQEEQRAPKLIASRPGRVVSVGGLVERVLEQFGYEYRDDAAAIIEADTPTKRRSLVRDVAEYVFGVESVLLSREEQADIIQRAYSEIFGYGPLDQLLQDERVTTIALEGTEKVAVRYAPGEELTMLEPLFDDLHHLRRIIKRVLNDAQAELNEDIPVIETGLTIEGRPISINVALPPFTTELTADIRVHPRQARTLPDLVQGGYLNTQAAYFLQALVKSDYGFVIVGDTESGKTTLLSALAQLLPHPTQTVAVERAGELRLPESIRRYTVTWGWRETTAFNFAHQVEAALATQPRCILLDELRSDEPVALKPLLTMPDPPRQIWSFRGAADTKRTRSALTMLARMSSGTETAVQALYDRLPFVITVKRRKGRIELREIAEWQRRADSEYPDYVELMTMGWEGVEITRKRPQHALALADSFWGELS